MQGLPGHVGGLVAGEVNRAGVATRIDYLRSAIYVVDTTNRPFRWHLPQPVPDMELIERFNRENGMTDYFVMPLPFQDATRTSTVSFASTRAGASPLGPSAAAGNPDIKITWIRGRSSRSSGAVASGPCSRKSPALSSARSSSSTS